MRLTNANAQIRTLWSNFSILLAITLVLSLSCLPTTWALSDKRLCADEKCERIISTGIAKINYQSGEDGMISFKINSPVRILSKSAGNNMKLWGVEINGRRGYANKDFIMEKTIIISEKDLKYELPVQRLKPAAGVVPIVNNPEQAEAKPKEAAQLPQEQQPPVLNASETAEDVATTTTSPLDTLKLSILTEQDQSGSSEVSTPITPVKANLQLVDGTELPLEALQATTERIENLTKVETAQEPRQSAKIEETPTATTSNDEFDYEEDDDDGIYNEDDDEDSTLDSKDNEILNDKASNVASKTDGKTNVAPEVVVAIPEPVASTPSQATPVVVQPEELSNSSLEAEAKHAVPVETTAQTVPESIPTPIPIISEVNVVKPTEGINAPPEPAVEVKLEQQPQAPQPEEATKPIDIDLKNVEQPIQKPLEVKQTEADVTKETITAQPIVKEQVKEQTEATEATTVANDTSAQEAKIEMESPKVFEPIEALTQNITEPAAQLDIKAQEEPATVETQNVQFEIKTESKPTPMEMPKTEAEPVKIETKAAVPEEIKDDKIQEELKAETTAQPTELNQSKVETEPKVSAVTEDQQVKAEIQVPKEVQQTEVNETEARQIESQPALEQIETTTAPYAVHDSSTATPREETVAPPSLPPLFNKQNFNNPNEYYKQLQEQQRQLEMGVVNQQQQQQEAEHVVQQVVEVAQVPQTTPTPSSYDAYEAVHQAEPTPAPAAAAVTEERLATGTVEPIGLPSLPADPVKEDAGPGLFTTIMDTVNSFISNQGQGQKEPKTAPLTGNDELHRLLYPSTAVPEVDAQAEDFCKRPMDGNCHAAITLDNFVEVFASKVLDHSLLLLCVVIAAASSLFFMLVYYCFCNSSQEGALLSKLNHLERSLLAAHKENLILKHDLMTTRTKLSSIEDNSFGSNDMVAALKKQLETELYEKGKLQEQVTSLEKDLDNAAEAGLELNKMLSEVLNGQNGDEAFMSTVEELQQQLNDQEKIIIEINASLAEKSRENSELQYSYTESTTRLTSEMKSLQQDNYELEMEKAKLQTRIEQIQAETEQELAKALEARNFEMKRLQHQIMESNAKLDKEHSELQTSLAKIESLEECLKLLKKDGNVNMQELIKSAKTRGELNATQQRFHALQTKLDQELAAKSRLESQLKASSADVEQLKQDFNQSERDKLEAQTRLEVLSGYFREKETELQKELSLQEAKWLQHQGENASTVETLTLMKNEIQTLKSQNDELRAEIEAQIASHKAQMGTLENRAHESWLAARQSERRCEEAQAEAAGLRRKLTTMASGGAVGGAAGDMSLDALPANGSMLASELNSNPSPLPLPLPGSPGLLNMPNPLPFLPAPFSPFMGLPPPFLPPAAAAGGARLPPLGRMRSPPPTSSSRGDRYDDRDDYSDYDEYDDEEEDERIMDQRRRHSGSWGRGGHRDDYMHSPRTYRSLSPSDSRYNYNDTETDFSPPPSPPPPRKSSRPINEV